MLSKVTKFIRELNSTVVAITSLFGVVSVFAIYFRDLLIDFLLLDVALPTWGFLVIALLLMYILYWIANNRPEETYKPITVHEEIMGLRWRIMVDPKYWIESDLSKFGKEYCDSLLADPDCPHCGFQIIGKWDDRVKYTDLSCVHCGHESDFEVNEDKIAKIPTHEAKFMVLQGLQRHCRNKRKSRLKNNEKFRFTLK